MEWLARLFAWFFPSVSDPEIQYIPLNTMEEMDTILNIPEPTTSRLALCYEAQPWVVTQKWGVKDRAYERFGFTHHNGTDIKHGYNSRLRAPFSYAVVGTMYQAEGGGNVLSIVSEGQFEAPDGQPAHVRIDYLHLSRYLKVQGSGGTGDLLCLAGNTGYSTGPHTHIQHRWVRRIKGRWVDVEKNDANNSFDPTPFYTGEFAVDFAK